MRDEGTFFADVRTPAAGAVLTEQLAAPASLTVRSAGPAAASCAPVLALAAFNSRNAVVRSSRILFMPWHSSSQPAYLLAACSLAALSAASECDPSAVGDAAPAVDAADGDAEADCGACDFADCGKPFDGESCLRARYGELYEFTQKYTFAVPSACLTACRCSGHCPMYGPSARKGPSASVPSEYVLSTGATSQPAGPAST